MQMQLNVKTETPVDNDTSEFNLLNLNKIYLQKKVIGMFWF